ncbi:hypothetical protein O181_083883 [Austropuccinia psidii MF-1]|uniref:Uncharacterized protein n=1 Tax=Austropuccinia psidii MF-1 TaxID=1389203 RepID=A0A9Q3FUI9_9BASI|nr:hypothetical protein [Austropuccinia psidii MF-1]
MSDTMINTKILQKCGVELEHYSKSRYVEPCSTEYYINAMEDIINRTGIGKTSTRHSVESNIMPKTSREYRRPEIPILKCHKCGITSNLASTSTKDSKMNEAQVFEEVQCTEEKEESDQDSEISEDVPEEYFHI